MPSYHRLADFLPVFKKAYETADIRSAVIRDGQRWLLVAMSVHYRVHPAKTAEKEFEELITRFGRIDSQSFRIIQQCSTIDTAAQLLERIKEGQLTLGDLRIGLTERFDVLSLTASLRDQRRERWPRIELDRQVTKDNEVHILLNDTEVLRQTENAGYGGPHSAVETLLDVQFNSRGPGYVWVGFDLPVRLLPPEVSRSNADEFELQVRAESHPAVREVTCTMRQERRFQKGIVQQCKVKLTRSRNDKKSSSLWTGRISVPATREDWVTLEVGSPQIGRLHDIHVDLFKSLPAEQINPMLATLELFCPSEKVRLLLEEPHKAQITLDGLKNPGRLFELSIQWLLSLLGYQALWLHGFESLKEGKVVIGTVDCLAYSERLQILLLINCSLVAPNQTELRKQEDVKTRIQQQLFHDSNLKVFSVLFTAAHRPDSETHDSSVVILYKKDIGELLADSRTGNEFTFQTVPISGVYPEAASLLRRHRK